MTVAVARFLGSNCDLDCLYVLTHVLQKNCVFAWHDEVDLPKNTTAVVIPGGFSYGDYLRCGAMAAHRPIMKAIAHFVQNGGPVIGICNGFQILCEAKILPGVLLPNQKGHFVCKVVNLVINENKSNILKYYNVNEKIKLNVAHASGKYFADELTLENLEKNKQIAICYDERDENGNAKVNGSTRGIAGILGGPQNNVLGLMPHPERRSEERLGGVDGLRMLRGLVA